MSLANLLTEWSGLLLDSLAAAGITDVIVSPGSRSTPLVLAAHAHPRLRVLDAIDERAAAFYALGQARVTGRPSLLLCTSGTAGAHYLPAVIEAAAAHLPLVVLTADRPFELQACAAPQTIDQRSLLGDKVRGSFELGLPDASDGALRALRRIAAQAVLLSLSPTPGAVHLNARARKPLEPQPARTDAEHELSARVARLRALPSVRVRPPRMLPDAALVDEVAELVRVRERGLLVLGPAPLAQAELRRDLVELAARSGFVLCAEATSQLRFGTPEAAPLRCDAFDALLRCPAWLSQHPVECVLQIGPPPTSSGLEQLLATRPDLARVVVAEHGWNDPHSSAQALLVGEVAASVRGLVAALPPRAAVSAWQETWRRADAVAARLAEGQLGGDPARPLGEAEAVRASVARLPPGSLLVVGNSLPIREIDQFCPGTLADVRVLSQRGVNGIDGLVSGAAGAASVAACAVTLLVGDISLLHDLGGLGLARAASAQPLVIVVLNNQGGRIFEQLPVAPALSQDADAALRHFTTPHTLALAAAAQLFGLRYARAETESALVAALDAAYASPGCTLVEALLPPHSAAEAQRRFFAALPAAL